MKDYYKILELPFGATIIEIKKAYHRLAFKYHPDKNFGNPAFEEKFKEINEAYVILSDKYKRILYHSEYLDFLNRRTSVHIPVTPVSQDPAFQYPRRPRGPATRVTIEYKELKIAVVILFLILIIFMIYESIGHMNELTEIKEIDQNTDTLKQPYHVTKEEYYQIISKEFDISHDSSLLKRDVDSMMNLMDSLINAENK